MLSSRQFTDANQERVPYTGQPVSWRVSAYVIVKKDERVLIIKNRTERLYDVVGGGVEIGETIAEAVAREAMEEAGARVSLGPLLHVAQDWFYHQNGQYYQTLQLFYSATLVGELETPTDPSTEWVGWVEQQELGTQYRLPPVVESLLLTKWSQQHHQGNS